MLGLDQWHTHRSRGNHVLIQTTAAALSSERHLLRDFDLYSYSTRVVWVSSFMSTLRSVQVCAHTTRHISKWSLNCDSTVWQKGLGCCGPPSNRVTFTRNRLATFWAIQHVAVHHRIPYFIHNISSSANESRPVTSDATPDIFFFSELIKQLSQVQLNSPGRQKGRQPRKNEGNCAKRGIDG